MKNLSNAMNEPPETRNIPTKAQGKGMNGLQFFLGSDHRPN